MPLLQVPYLHSSNTLPPPPPLELETRSFWVRGNGRARVEGRGRALPRCCSIPRKASLSPSSPGALSLPSGGSLDIAGARSGREGGERAALNALPRPPNDRSHCSIAAPLSAPPQPPPSLPHSHSRFNAAAAIIAVSGASGLGRRERGREDGPSRPQTAVRRPAC